MNIKISLSPTIINNTYVRISYSSKEPNATVITNQNANYICICSNFKAFLLKYTKIKMWELQVDR